MKNNILSKIYIDNFKSYSNETWIDLSNLNIFLGANSSGKSTALQALLVLKQTFECNSPNIDLLLSGKYVTLGDFDDVINNPKDQFFKIGISTTSCSEYPNSKNKIIWYFEKFNSLEKGVKLNRIEIDLHGKQYSLIHYNNKLYSMYVNGKETQILLKITNLDIEDMYFRYSEKLNDVFNDYLFSLLKLFSSQEKITNNKKQPACIDGIRNFYQYIFNGPIKKRTKRNSNFDKLINEIFSLITDFSALEFDSGVKTVNLYGLENEVINNLLTQFITSSNKNEIQKLVNEYRMKYNDLKSENLVLNKLEKLNIYFWLNTDEKNNSDLSSDQAYEIQNFNRFIHAFFKNIFYVGPIREKPQSLYNIGFESIPKYVGTSGAYFASVLLRENNRREYILPNGSRDDITLYEALDNWLIHLNIASEVQINRSNSFGFNVLIKNIENKKSDIMNVGIGVSQVLPVLITGLLSEEKELLIFEQPELHLHPYSQSRLADFMELANNNRNIIVETHSEYMLLRLRYNVLTEKIQNHKISINFFENKNGTNVIKKEINT